jgi:ArsR family transcriptional regulator
LDTNYRTLTVCRKEFNVIGTISELEPAGLDEKQVLSLNNVDVLLDILGNDTRRRILQLLANEPRYFIQLSRDLGVSQQAVLKHLEILERHGFITSYEEESSLPAPKRKYFQLNMSCMLAIGITSDAVNFVFQDIPSKSEDSDKKAVKSLTKRAQTLEVTENPIELLNKSDELLKEINAGLKELMEEETLLLRLKQRITRAAHRAIRDSFEEELQRHILYSTIGEEKQPDVDELSVILDAREKQVSQALKELRQKMSGSAKDLLKTSE